MNIADAWRHGIHGAGAKALGGALGDDFAVRRDTVTLRNFRATQHADQAPNRVVVNRRRLPRPPDETDDRKALPRVRVQQVLLIALGIGPRECVGQPVVVSNQFTQRGRAGVEQRRFGCVAVDERRDLADERA